jgi:hypothetical protein
MVAGRGVSARAGRRQSRSTVGLAVAVAVGVLVLGILLGLVPRPVSARAQTLATAGGTFRAVTPARLLDTRQHNGGSRVAPRGTLHLLVLGRGGVPASTVSAVFLTVVVTRPAAAGYVTAYADGSARPGTSSVNFRTGFTVSDEVTARVGSNGRVALYNGSAGSVDLVADVYGYVIGPSSTGPGSFVATFPARLLDSRSSPVTRSPAAHGAVTVPVAGHAGIPTSGVGAVALTVTAVAPQSPGSVDAYPAGGHAPPQPATTFDAGITTAGATVVAVGVGGAVTLANDSAGTTAVLVDVVGYFVSGPAGPTGMYVPVPPTTLHVDSPIAGRTSASVNLSSHGIVPDYPAMAVLLAVTVTATSAGFITPTRSSLSDTVQGTSALSVRAGSTASGLVVARPDADVVTSAALWNGSHSAISAHVAVLGYFVSAPGAGAVAGRVTDTSSGAGLAGVVVSLWDPDPDQAEDYREIYGTATSGPDGRYTIAGVQNGGSYMLCFDADNVTNGPPHTVYAGQCWQNKPYDGVVGFPHDSTVVHTSPGTTTSGIDAALASTAAGSISGVVTSVGGVPLPGVQVRAGEVFGTTDADGGYHLDGIPAGPRTVHADPGSAHGTGAPYGYLPKDSDPVTVIAGADTAGVNLELPAQSAIVGHVVSSTGAHFGGGYVEVFSPDGGSHSADFDIADGSYTVTGFTGGTYTICFHVERPVTSTVPTYGWGDQCYDRASWMPQLRSPSDAAPVTVAAGAQRSIDATIEPAGSIAGTVRSAPGGAGVERAEIDVFDATTRELVRADRSRSDGTYLVTEGLSPATTGYIVCVNGSTVNLGSVCYPNVPWTGANSAVPNGTTPVPVSSGAVHGGVDLVLPPA